MNPPTDSDKLLKFLQGKSAYYRCRSRIHYYTHHLFIWILIIFVPLIPILYHTDIPIPHLQHDTIMAVISVIPAMFAAAVVVFRYNDKFLWHIRKHQAISVLALELEYGVKDTKTIIAEYRGLEVSFENLYPLASDESVIKRERKGGNPAGNV